MEKGVGPSLLFAYRDRPVVKKVVVYGLEKQDLTLFSCTICQQ